MSTSATRKIYHSSASGIVPNDTDYGILGPQKSSEDSAYSPFPRINRLRKIFQETPMSVDATRVRVYTEVFKGNEDKSMTMAMKKALSLKKFMEECKLTYLEGDLLPMDDGSPWMKMNIYPEYIHWQFDELRSDVLRTRSYLKHVYDDAVRDEILSYEDYWKGKDVATAFRAILPEDAAKGCGIAGGMLVINSNVNLEMGVGHTTPNYERLLEMGLGGLKEYVRGYKDKLGMPVTEEGIKALQFYEASLVELDAWSDYFRRHAAFAREQRELYDSSQTKDELKTLADMFDHLAEGTPRTFWEAVLLTHSACVVYMMDSLLSAVGLGRLDVYLYPYYKADMEKGILTKEFAQELIDMLFLRNDGIGAGLNSTNEQYQFGFRGIYGSEVMIGGVDADGNDITNDLSFMLLDGTAHTRQSFPFTAVRWHEKTPYELKLKVAETMRLGTGHPKIMNDKPIIEALVKLGCSLEDARDYGNIGCVECSPVGKDGGWVDVGAISLPKVLELALNNGCCMITGDTIGLETGYLKDFKTFDEVKAAYEAQLKYWTDRLAAMVNAIMMAVAQQDEHIIISLLADGCIESGVSWLNGGAEYNFAGCQSLGPATVADSLTTLRKHVYEDKTHTAEEFYNAIMNNWEGHERLYQLVSSDKTPHYGNDDDYADEMMTYVMHSYADLMQSYPPARGKWKFTTGSFSQVVNVLYGSVVGATPDGRKHNEAVSANVEAVRTIASHRDVSGPTAFARSVGKFDHSKFSTGTLVNYKFGTDTVSGKQGRENLVDFLDGYFENDPLHIQVMVTNSDTLVDAKIHPEEYNDLIVRVSGFSSYFTALNERLQDELIERTEHEL